MGCAASKKGSDDVVLVCRERKRLLKLAVERRYAFAEAHSKYNQSLTAVAEAIRLFVARQSSPSSPFLITFPSSVEENPTQNTYTSTPMLLQQTPTKPTHEKTLPFQSFESTVCMKREKKEEEVEEEEETTEGKFEENHVQSQEHVVCEQFHGEFGWDYFYPFDNAFSEISEENIRVVREEEGIPELEEDESEKIDENMSNCCVGHDEEISDVRVESSGTDLGKEEDLGFEIVDRSNNGRELLEALKDVEDHFLRAYDSGLDISRMLEATRVQLHSSIDEIKENSNKLIRSITWSRTNSFRSSPSCKSVVTSSSKSSSTWTESKKDLFDDYGGMKSGSHSLTLERLYAWEKKLYEEVKVGEETRKIYERKCSLAKNKDTNANGMWPGDKTRAELKDLHTRILVALRRVESISEQIHKLRDEELHPQLMEMLHGLMKNWKIMMETHETQNRTMFEVTSFNCPSYGKFLNDSHRLATLQLEAELHDWRVCFAAYVSTQKAYIEALGSWLLKFVAPELEFFAKESSSVLQSRNDWPPLLVTCYDWLVCLEKLPDKDVMSAMKSFGKDIHNLWVQQGDEQQQKRKVDGVAKELERKISDFKRTESKILESEIPDQEFETNVRNRIEYLAERKNQLDIFQKRLESERARHLTSMRDTKEITVNGFQMGFSSVFESLAEFSKASVQIYADLVTNSENGDAGDEKDINLSYIEEMSSHMLC